MIPDPIAFSDFIDIEYESVDDLPTGCYVESLSDHVDAFIEDGGMDEYYPESVILESKYNIIYALNKETGEKFFIQFFYDDGTELLGEDIVIFCN